MTENIHKIVSACITIAGFGKRRYKNKITTDNNCPLLITCQEIAKLTENLGKGRFVHQIGLRLFVKVNVMNPVPFFTLLRYANNTQQKLVSS